MDSLFYVPGTVQGAVHLLFILTSIFIGCVLSCFSCIQIFVPLWTAACQALLSLGLSRQEYWSGLSCPPPGDLPDPGIKPRSPALQADFLPGKPPGKLPTREAPNQLCVGARWLQSCLTLCNPMDSSPPSSSVQARILEWVVMPSSRKSSQPRDRTQVSSIAGGFLTT